MKVTVHYKDGESDLFNNLSAVIHKRKAQQLVLIRNATMAPTAGVSGQRAEEITIPVSNVRWWKVER